LGEDECFCRRDASSSVRVDIDVTNLLGSYTVAIQQMVAIARALYMASAKILILDEPTSSLDVNELNSSSMVMKKLKNEGVWYHIYHSLY